MPIWRYTERQNWHQSIHKTPILPLDKTEEVKCRINGFIWPEWAINMVNKLGGTKEAIQKVSELLEQERKNLWPLQH